MNPRDEAVARIDAVLHEWCSLPVDLCFCNPRPLPEPAPSSVVRALQRGQRAETASPVSEGGVWPDTHGTAAGLSATSLGPITALSPGYYRTGGAA